MRKILLATAALLTLASANGIVDNITFVSAQDTVVPQPGSAVIKVVDIDNQPVANTKIELLTQDLGSGRQATTDEFGNAVFSDLPEGTYVHRYVEVPEGFVKPEVATEDLPSLEVEAHKSNTDTILTLYREGEQPESPQPGSVIVKIVDAAHNGLAGAQVELLNEDMSQGRQVTTDEFGNAVFTDVLPGTYHYRLAVEPEGYVYNGFTGSLDAVSHETVDGFIALDAVEVPEAPQPGSVIIKIVDSAHNGLAGAQVELLNEDMSQGRQATTDEFGNAVFTDVLPGTYHYRLAAEPEGYVYNGFTGSLDAVSHETVDGFIALDAVEVPEAPQPGSVVIKIVDTAHNGLAGAVVELLNEDMSQGRQVTTDEFGNAVFTDVLPGTYHYRLAIAPKGYDYNAFTASIQVVSHEINDSGWIALDKTVEAEVTQAPVVSVETSVTTIPSTPSTPRPSTPTTTEAPTTTIATTTTTNPVTTTSVAVTSAAKTEPTKKAQLPETGETMTLASYALAALFVVAAGLLLLPKFNKE
ncbi:TPA: collagen binding domain-containing protein [Streptococcus suis]